MNDFKTFLKAGHAPTLAASFLYFAFSCCIWVLNGAMAPFITEDLQLTAAQKGLMLSIPIFAGALMRFPLGILAQYIGRKPATLVEMGLIAAAMLYGYFAIGGRLRREYRRRERQGGTFWVDEAGPTQHREEPLRHR